MEQQVGWLERRARTLTGSVLAVMALLACYGLLIFEGQLTRPAFHFYPWLAAVLFYLAGDLLAYIWFKVVTIKIDAMIRKLQAESIKAEQRTLLADQDDLEELNLVDADVEVVRPGQPAD